MSSYNLKLEVRLQHWAAWIIQFEEKELGYPSESTLAKLLREGFTSTENKSRTSSEPWNYPHAEEINTLFNQLSAIDRDKAAVIYIYYITRISLKRFAIKMKVAPSTMYRRLNSAKNWFAERIA